MAGFLGSAFAADNFSDRLTNFLIGAGVKIPASTLDTIAVIFITLILSYFTLVLGELVPKRIAMKHAEKIALVMSRLLRIISIIFAPIVWFLTVSTNGVLRLFGIDPKANANEVTEDEIRLMVDASNENGAIDNEEREFIHKLFEFDDLVIEELMTHRANAVLLWLDENIERWEETINEKIHTFYPVCNESVDNVVGILNTKDYFRLKEKTRQNILALLKPAYFVPETIYADVLFRNMKKTKNHFAVVVDEYGGMSGIITINDLLEQLVGNFDDNITNDNEQQQIELIDTKTWKIKGDAPIKMVSKQLGIVLPDDEYDTFGGLVFDLLGTIPPDGETVEAEGFGLKINVIEIKKRRLITAVVCILENGIEIKNQIK